MYFLFVSYFQDEKKKKKSWDLENYWGGGVKYSSNFIKNYGDLEKSDPDMSW